MHQIYYYYSLLLSILQNNDITRDISLLYFLLLLLFLTVINIQKNKITREAVASRHHGVQLFMPSIFRLKFERTSNIYDGPP